MSGPSFPPPQGGVSLMLSFRLERQTVLVIGGNTLAASRAFAALEADAKVVVMCPKGYDGACEELQWRETQGQLSIIDSLPPSDPSPQGEAATLEKLLSDLHESIRFVCITDTIIGSGSRSRSSAASLSEICRSHRVLVNVTDEPSLCDFSFSASHRFLDTKTGLKSPLQVGVTTNGKGCRLAGRVRREIVTRLPKAVGGAAIGVSRLRDLAKEEANGTPTGLEIDHTADDGSATPNLPVTQRTINDLESSAERARRQMRWVAQVSEYWPLDQLGAMGDEDALRILSGTLDAGPSPGVPVRPQLAHASDSELTSLHTLRLNAEDMPPPRKGRILLVGSGPGHPSLLTRATHTALTELADLVLSDKLVPSAVLDLIPPSVEVRIARKFPGNAEGAQNELMEMAIEAANRGLTVVRVSVLRLGPQTLDADFKAQLKQGDPTVYGRVGEEVLYFRAHGFESVVIPGVTSALAGPTFAGIPVTQRGVAESVVVCTGVGRAGKEVQLPDYERPRTLVVLMGVARLNALLERLRTPGSSGVAYPPHLPIAIIERASMPDQRTVYSTLGHIAQALESIGEQRPPGMIVIGWAVLALHGAGDMTVLDAEAEQGDEDRVQKWLCGESWRVVEGFDGVWDDL